MRKGPVNNELKEIAMSDRGESTTVMNELDPNQIVEIARSLIHQQIENFPTININEQQFDSNFVIHFPERNIYAARAMVAQIFTDTAMYLFNMIYSTIPDKFGYVDFRHVGCYPYTIDLANINMYLSGVVNRDNIMNIASTQIYSAMVRSVTSYGSFGDNDRSKLIIDETEKDMMNNYINILSHILNCLGYFAHESSRLLFPNTTINPKSVNENIHLY